MKQIIFEFSKIVNGKHYGYERHQFTEEDLTEILKKHLEDDNLENGRITEIQHF